MKSEILAPVGGREQLNAALRSGADAVYLGTRNFNARRNAENFDAAGLDEVVSVCHLSGVRVHVTFNTLLSDGELASAEEEMRRIAAAGVDAVIVQDTAAARLFRTHCPTLQMHASTQMAIHNAEGAMQAYDLGFRRVVLARELSLEEIKSIRSRVPADLELEAFVHGALCVSLSGACYLSSMIGGRSGNRGLCAGPCRLDFKCRGRDHVLSLKDMSYIERIRELADAGVSSFKIEGRMKGPAYVAAAVHACRVALDGGQPDMKQLEAIFSRSGFTDGYLTGNLNASMFGTRTKEDALSATDAEKETAALTRAVYQSVGLDASLTLSPDVPAVLTLSDGEHTVSVSGAAPIIPRTAATDRETALKNLSKTGGTPFYIQSFSFSNPSALMVPPSALNAMRREAIEALSHLRSRVTPHPYTDFPLVLPAQRHHKKPAVWLQAHEPSQLDFDEDADRILLPAEKLTPALAARYGERLIAVLPPVSFEKDRSRLENVFAHLDSLGVKKCTVNNIGVLRAAREHGLELHGDFGLNIYNSLALEAYQQMGLSSAVISFELSARDIERLGGDLPRGIIGYGRLPLMRLRACPGRGEKGCGKCEGSLTLVDRLGMEFPVACDRRLYSTLYNTLPLYTADRMPGGIDYSVMRFTFESAAEAEKMYRKYIGGVAPRTERTYGLYYRETK